jgi:hypothetical protein
MKIAFLALPLLLAAAPVFAADSASGSDEASIPAACNPDMQKFCASAATDEAKIDCLAQNEAKLSQACRAAMDADDSQGQQGQNQPSGY